MSDSCKHVFYTDYINFNSVCQKCRYIRKRTEYELEIMKYYKRKEDDRIKLRDKISNAIDTVFLRLTEYTMVIIIFISIMLIKRWDISFIYSLLD